MTFIPPKHLSRYFSQPMKDFRHWRESILKPFIIERENGLCWIDSCWKGGHSMHEGIVTKGDVQGWPRENRALINVPYNTLILCFDCHKNAPSKEDVLLWMMEYYGIDVLDFFDSLPFVHNPIQGLINHYRKVYQNEI